MQVFTYQNMIGISIIMAASCIVAYGETRSVKNSFPSIPYLFPPPEPPRPYTYQGRRHPHQLNFQTSAKQQQQNLPQQQQNQPQQHNQQQQQQQQTQQQPSINYQTSTPQNDAGFFQRLTSWFGFGGGSGRILTDNNGGNNYRPNTISTAAPKPQPAKQYSQQYRHMYQYQQPQQNYQPQQYQKQQQQQQQPPPPQQQLAVEDTGVQYVNLPVIAAASGEPKSLVCLPCNQIPWMPMFPDVETPLIKVPGVKFDFYPRVPDVSNEAGDSYFPKDEVEPIPSITSTTTTTTTTPRPSYTYSPESGGKVINNDALPIYGTNDIAPRNSVPIFSQYRPATAQQSNLFQIENTNRIGPIPVPELSATPLPPLHDAKSFYQNIYGSEIISEPARPSTVLLPSSQSSAAFIATAQYSTGLSSPAPFTLPSSSAPPSANNIIPHEIINKLQIGTNNDIEIIKSIPIAHYSSASYEYPSNFQETYGKNIENIKDDIKMFNGLVDDPILVNNAEIFSDNNAMNLIKNYTIGNSDDTYSTQYILESTVGPTVPSTTTESSLSTYYDAPVESSYAQQRTLFKYSPQPNDPTPPQWQPSTGGLISTTQPPNIFNYSPQQSNIPTTLPWQPPSTMPTPTTSQAPLRYSSTGTDVKRPKQIQIIVPYTSASSNRPRPFNTFANWNQIGGESHVVQESRIIAATQRPDEPKTTRYLTKILANNIRELLHREKDQTIIHESVTEPVDNSIDIEKLQSTIDDWTEQEFSTSNMNQKASTISFLAPSKHIPAEYLTTTPITPTTTTTATNPPPTTARPHSPAQRMLDYSAWENLGITISPITHEKVHVVTPQRIDLDNFKSPRFLIRPTPGARQTPQSTTSDVRSTLAYSVNTLQPTAATTPTPLLKPKLFGFMNYFSPLSEFLEKEERLNQKKPIHIVTPLPYIANELPPNSDEN